MTTELTHIDKLGKARIVDITGKTETHRRATARCRVIIENVDHVPLRSFAGSGDPFGEAVIAGIQAAKRTPSIIPLCHSIRLTEISVDLFGDVGEVLVTATTATVAPTGVEMEALTACAFSALSVVGACRARGVFATIEDLTLWEKSGGRSGTWRRPAEDVTPLPLQRMFDREAR